MTEPNKSPETIPITTSSTINIGGDDAAVIDIRDSKFAGRDLIERYVEQEIIVKIDSLEDVPPLPGDPPYKGLTYFTEADADLFFGREDLVARLMARLTDDRFLAVIGASGSGKSSLLRAGVIPRLRAKNWQIYTFTPTAFPLSALANTLARDEPLGTASTLTEQFSTNPQTLLQVSGQLAARQTSDRILIFVDQFEELFTLCGDEAERQAFLDNLMTAASAESTTTVIISMRADFYARCDRYEQLREAVSSSQEYVGPMNQIELIRAIVEPARRNGWRFVDGLVEQIVDDVRDEPGRLPLLSHALLETWRGRKGNVMTLSGYRAVGGVEGAIAKSAETTYTTLSDTQKLIAQRVFLSLTEINDNAVETRRRATRKELLADVGNAADVEQVLDRLARARLITVDEDDVEVAHEALIREWPSLHTWLEENREALVLRRRLLRAATEWDNNNRDAGFLYRGARLAETQEWCAANPGEHLTSVERDFLDESNAAQVREHRAELEAERQAAQLEAERRSARRLRLLRNGLVVVAVLMIIAAVWALIGQIQASRARDAAFEAQESAESSAATAVVAQQTAEAGEAEIADLSQQIQAQRLAIASSQLRNIDPELALLLGEAAVNATYRSDDATYVPDARAALYQSLHPPQLAAPIAVLHGHSDTVKSAEFSADGTRLLTSSADGHARLWDVASGETAAILPGHQWGVSAVEFSPDSTRIVTTADDQGAWLWDGVTGEQITILADEPGFYLLPEFNRDGTRLLIAPSAANSMLYDGKTGDTIKHIQTTTDEQSAGAKQIQFTPDGTKFFTLSQNDELKLWDATTGEPAASIDLDLISSPLRVTFDATSRLLLVASGNERKIIGFNTESGTPEMTAELPANSHHFVAAPQGGLLAVALADKSIAMVSIPDGDIKHVFTDQDELLQTLIFSPDGKRMLAVVPGRSTGTEPMARLYDVEENTVIASLIGHKDSISDARFSHDGQLLITYSQDNTARIWNGVTGAPLGVLSGHTNNVRSADFSPDNKLVVTAGDTTVRLWDSDDGSLAHTLVQSDGPIQLLSYSPAGNLLAMAGKGHLAWLWHDKLATVEILDSPGDTSTATTLAFAPDGTHIAIGASIGTLSLWNTATTHAIRELDGMSSAIDTVAYDPDGRRLAAAGGFGELHLWNVETGELIAVYEGMVQSIAFAPAGELLAVGTQGFNQPNIINSVNGRFIAELPAHSDTITVLAFDSSGERLISGSSSGELFLHNVSDGMLLASTNSITEPVTTATFSHDGLRIGVGYLDGSFELWLQPNATSTVFVEGNGADVIDLAFSPDDTLLLVATRDRTPQLWRATTGEFVADLAGHTADLKSAEFSPDGNWIITTSDDTTARLWDGHTGEPIAVLEGHTDWVNATSFRPDSQFVATASDDGTVRVWRLFSAEIDDLLNEAASRIRRDFTDAECRRYALESSPTCNN